MEKGFDGADPGAVFRAGVEERPCLRKTFPPGPGDAESLRNLASEAEEENSLLDGFDSLSDRLAAEGRSEAEHAFDDGEIFRVVEHVAHEGLIDLENVNGQAFEEIQRS